MEKKKLTDKELDDILVSMYGIKYFIPSKENYYTLNDLNSIRTHKGSTESIIEVFGAVDDKAAQDLSEDKNATVEWFNETLPEADDITNLTMAEAVCATAISRYNKYKEAI